MTTIDFNSYKLMLINRISAAGDMQEIKDAFNMTDCSLPCMWTQEELKQQLQKSDKDLKAGRYMTGQKATMHFKERKHGSKMVG